MLKKTKTLLFFITALLVLVSATAAAGEHIFDPNHTMYENVLNQYVKDGLVDYEALQKNPQSLDRYLADISRVSKETFKSWKKDRQLAFLTNLYNAATLKLIVDHYPVDSIKDIGGWFKSPWSIDFVKLFGDTISLNTLEHEIIRKEYDEPRIHIALVCAAKGCPPLRGEAYTTEKLERQLEDQSKTFLSSQKGLIIDRPKQIVYLSSIFKWYGKDFVGKFTPESGFKGFNKKEQAVLNFCSGYLPEDNRTYLTKKQYSVKYLDYDWSLNDKKGNQ